MNNKVKVEVLKPLYPYNKGDKAEMRLEVAQMWEKKGYVTILGNNKAPVVVSDKEQAPVNDKSMAKKKKKTKAL